MNSAADNLSIQNTEPKEYRMSNKIPGTDEAWESRELGADLDHAKPVAPEYAQQIEDSLGLQMISIRLDKSLIDAFKMIGEFHGVGYQPLMRDALKRFAECEMRAIVQGVVESQRKRRTENPVKAKPVVRRAKAATTKVLKKAA